MEEQVGLFEIRQNFRQFAESGDGRVVYFGGKKLEGQKPYELEIYSNPPVVDRCKTVLANVSEEYIKSLRVEYYKFLKDKDGDWECTIYFNLG